MRALIFSDIHSDLKTLEKHMATEADLYVAAGDLVNKQSELDAVGRVLQAKADRVYVIPGNMESDRQIADFCAKFGLHDLHSRAVQVDSVHIAGLGCSNPTPFGTPGEYTEDELARRLASFAALNPLVLICHCPPKNTALDRAGEGKHFGSTAIAEFIEKYQPAHFYCGHIHEAWGATATLGRTAGRNVGKQGFLLDLDTLRS